MDTLYKDLRFGIRSLLKHPAFTALAVITLALGIGANTAIFTVVNGVLLRPLNFPEPERLVVVSERNPQQNTPPFELSYLNWSELKQRSQSFEEIAGVLFTSYVMDLNGETSRVSALQISASLFPTLRAKAAQGRTFIKEDERPGADRVVVVSNGFWQRYFGNQALSGQGIKLDNRSYAVVGVMPPEFQFPDEKMEVWVTFGPDIGDKTQSWMTIVGVVGNVNHIGLDVEPDFATYEPHAKRPWSEMTLLVRTDADPTTLTGPIRAELKNAETEILIEDVITMSNRLQASIAPQRLNLVLLGSFAFVALVLAAVGIYGVMAQIVAQRTHEIGIRMALGAQVKDVLRLVLQNGMTLAVIGVAIGLTGAFWVTRLMANLLFGVTPTDALVFASVPVALLVVAFLACYIPARRATKVDPLVALRYE